MPAIYAHNQFGNKVLQHVDVRRRKQILEYLPQFRIGLQGPDYLFFYKPLSKNPISQVGFDLHKTVVAGFLEHAKQVIQEIGTDSPEYAYMLGFICHFTLDSECHPYVASEMKRTGVGHVEMESEFEKYLLRMNGEDPFSYPVGKTFPTDPDTVDCMTNLYEDVERKDVEKALKSMKFCKTLLVAPGNVKRTVLEIGMHLSGHYDSIQEHMLKKKDNPRCVVSNEGLYNRLISAVPLAEKLMNDFDAYLEGEELDERFQRDFE